MGWFQKKDPPASLRQAFLDMDKKLGLSSDNEKVRPLGNRTHTYCIGQVGTGKTRFLRSLIRKDIEQEEGCVIVADAKGELYYDILADLKGHFHYPDSFLKENVILIDLNRPDCTPALNLLKARDSQDILSKQLYTDGITGRFKDSLKPYFGEEGWGPRIEQTLTASLNLISYNNLSPLDILSIIDPYSEESNILIEKLIKTKDLPVQIKEFWEKFKGWKAFHKAEYTATTMTKLTPLSFSTVFRHAFGSGSTIDLRESLKGNTVILANLSMASPFMGLGETRLLGTILFNEIFSLLMERQEHEGSLNPVYIYADEFYKYASDGFSDIVSLLRSKGAQLTLAHQDFDQLAIELGDKGEKIIKTIIGQCSTKSIFRLSGTSAKLMSEEIFPPYEPAFNWLGNGIEKPDEIKAKAVSKIMALEKRQCLISFEGQKPFLLETEEVIDPPNKEKLIENLFEIVFHPEQGYPYFISRKEAERRVNLKRESLSPFYVPIEKPEDFGKRSFFDSEGYVIDY